MPRTRSRAAAALLVVAASAAGVRLPHGEASVGREDETTERGLRLGRIPF